MAEEEKKEDAKEESPAPAAEKKEAPPAPKSEKKPEPPAEEPQAKGGKVVTGLIILVLIIIVIQIVYLVNTSKNQGTVTTGSQPAAPVESVSPPPGAPTNMSPAPADIGSASSGTIRMDKLFYGLMKLEESPVALKKDQAQKVLMVMTSQENGFKGIDYGSNQLGVILTSPQKDFFKKVAEMGAGKPPKMISNESVNEIIQKLTQVAGGPVTTVMQVPADYKVTPPKPAQGGAPNVPVVMLLLQSFDAMQKEKAAAVTPDQAKRIIPILNGLTLTSADPVKQILDLLTKEQKEQIDKSIKGSAEKPELMRDYPIKLAKLYQEKIK